MSYQVFANNSEEPVYDSVGPQCELDSSGNVRQNAVYYRGQAMYGNVPVPQAHSTNHSNRHQEPPSLSQLQQLWQLQQLQRLQRMQHIDLQYQHAQPTSMAPVYHQQAPPSSMPLIAHLDSTAGGGFSTANRMEHTIRYTQDFTSTSAPTLGMMYTHGYRLCPPPGAVPVQSLPYPITQFPPPSQGQFMRTPAAAYGLEAFNDPMLPQDTNFTNPLGQCNYQTPVAQQENRAAAKGVDCSPDHSMQSCTEIQFEHWQQPALDVEREKEKENIFLHGEQGIAKGKGRGKGKRESEGKGKGKKRERSLPYYRHKTQDAQRTASSSCLPNPQFGFSQVGLVASQAGCPAENFAPIPVDDPSSLRDRTVYQCPQGRPDRAPINEVFRCKWDNCGLLFRQTEVGLATHFDIYHPDAFTMKDGEFRCQWTGIDGKPCKRSVLSERSLYRHVFTAGHLENTWKCTHSVCDKAFGRKHVRDTHSKKCHD